MAGRTSDWKAAPAVSGRSHPSHNGHSKTITRALIEREGHFASEYERGANWIQNATYLASLSIGQNIDLVFSLYRAIIGHAVLHARHQPLH